MVGSTCILKWRVAVRPDKKMQPVGEAGEGQRDVIIQDAV